MRIAIVNDNLLPNGAQIVAKTLACGLANKGHHICYFYFHRYFGVPSLIEVLCANGINVEWISGPRITYRRYGAWFDSLRLHRRCKKLGIDLINAHVWEASHSLFVTRHLPKSLPIVLTHHGTKICNSHMTTMNRLHLGVYSRYRYEYEKRDDNRNCFSIDLGLDADILAAARIPKAKARDILHVPRNAKIVLTVGRANRHRGCDLWIDIIKNLERKHREDFYFVFIGADRGEYLDNLTHMAKNNSRIIVKGTLSHSDVLTWMCASDVLLMTSRTESFAIKAVEALYCGCSVVSHYLGVLSDLIQEGVNGTIVDYMDIEGMGKAVEYWLDGHQPPPFTLPERYTVSAMVSAYENCFVNLLAKKKLSGNSYA